MIEIHGQPDDSAVDKDISGERRGIEGEIGRDALVCLEDDVGAQVLRRRRPRMQGGDIGGGLDDEMLVHRLQEDGRVIRAPELVVNPELDDRPEGAVVV